MGTATPGDGALPGSYRFLIMPIALGDSELAAGMTPAVGSKYSKFESSGITFEVTDGSKELNITVEKPKGKN